MRSIRSTIVTHPGLFKALVSLAALGATVIATEAGFRVVSFLVKGPDKQRSVVAADPTLGWHLNTARPRLTKKNRCGEQVILEPYGDPYLVKRPAHSADLRVLFLGDSYTHAHEVSTGKAYYDVFESLTAGRFSVFAAGVGGFGSLQEFLLLETVWDEVEPDIVVWQLHSNDVSNNVFALDSGSLLNNQRRRPYLDPNNEKISFDNPGFFLFDVSHVFRFLFYRLVKLDWTYNLGLLEAANSLIAPPEKELPALINQGFEVLSIVLGYAVKSHPQTQFFGFAADSKYDDEFRAIFESRGAGYFDGFERSVELDPQPTNCLPLDSHWNHHGNRVVGEILRRRLDQALTPESPVGTDPELSLQ